MHNLAGFLVGLVITIIVATLIIKRYTPQPVLLLAGILMLALAIPMVGEPLLDADKTTGSVFVDIFDTVRAQFSKTGGGLGLTIMSVGGFAMLMEKMGASESLVRMVMSPLKRVKRPYLILAGSYIVGQLLAIIIPSASGLALLFMVTMYPVLRTVGISKLSSAALIATTCCLDLGPNSANSNLAAEVSSMTVQEYFFYYQGPVAIVTMIVVSALHIICQWYFDKKAGTLPAQADWVEIKAELTGIDKKSAESNKTDGTPAADGKTLTATKSPMLYAFLPLLPLVVIILFSDFVIVGIKMEVTTVMIMSMLVAFVCECMRKRSFRTGAEVMSVFFEGMGKQFTNVVTLIISGQIFAAGLIKMGFTSYLITGAQKMNFGVFGMALLMSLVIVIAALVTGSGNAAWSAFAPLSSKVAEPLGEPTIMMALPMEMSAGIGRSMSPIAGVVIVVAGFAGVSTIDLVKRTIPVMVGAWITMFASSFILLHFVA